jgi:hypothetical protein
MMARGQGKSVVQQAVTPAEAGSIVMVGDAP